MAAQYTEFRLSAAPISTPDLQNQTEEERRFILSAALISTPDLQDQTEEERRFILSAALISTPYSTESSLIGIDN